MRLLVATQDGAPEVLIEATLGELGVSADASETVSRAMRVGRQGGPMARAHIADRARRGEIDVPLEPRLDTQKLFDRLSPAKETLDVSPVAARLDLGEHRVVEEHDGRALDLDGAANAVLRAASDPPVRLQPRPGEAGDAPFSDVDLPFVPVHSRVTRASLARVDVSHVLASFQTFFSRHGDQGPRARNIEVAASHVDGLVIEPGQLVSFNTIVGARSPDNGFKTAFEIVKGEYVEGTGGGTCQVASTLHAIAFFGGLEILERLPHSRPSAYIQAGLDATVVYPTVDLKLRNPFSFPVAVHATVAGYALRMELLGADKPVDVTFGKTVLSTTPFDRKVVEEAGLAGPKRKQKGLDGMAIMRARVLAFHDGHRKVEMSRDLYPPTKEIWQIPPGFDASTLPPLGEDMPKPDGASPGSPARGRDADPAKPQAFLNDAVRPPGPPGG